MKYLSPRALVMLALVLGACWFSTKYSAHHVGNSPFQTLYMHLMPSPLVNGHGAHDDEHAEDADDDHAEDDHAHAAPGAADYLVKVPLPEGLSVFATNQHELAHDEHGDEGEEGAMASTSTDDGHHHEAPVLALMNLQVFQIISVLLILVAFSGIPRYLKTGKGDAVTRLFTGWAMWVRDEMVYPVMGKDTGRKFLPYFLILFFFLLFINLMGLVPGSATATASIYVTGGMALTTLGAMLICGMAAQGPVAYWKNLVPHVPLALWPLMFLVELMGVVVKPFALMIRLFANMTGGHMVVLSFMGLIFFFGSNTEMFQDSAETMGYAVSPVAIGFAVFIMIIESFVAMLQAYIFTQLTVMFVGASVHPEH